MCEKRTDRHHFVTFLALCSVTLWSVTLWSLPLSHWEYGASQIAPVGFRPLASAALPRSSKWRCHALLISRQSLVLRACIQFVQWITIKRDPLFSAVAVASHGGHSAGKDERLKREKRRETKGKKRSEKGACHFRRFMSSRPHRILKRFQLTQYTKDYNRSSVLYIHSIIDNFLQMTKLQSRFLMAYVSDRVKPASDSFDQRVAVISHQMTYGWSVSRKFFFWSTKKYNSV